MFKIFLFLLIFCPLAFGTVEPWSYAVMEILSFWALALLTLRVARSKEPLLSVPGIVPLLLFLLYILFQITPLPAAFVKLLSPNAHTLHLAASAPADPGAWMPLSVHPAATLQDFFRWASYVAFYVLTVHLLRQGDRIRKTVITVTVFGALLALSAILQFYMTDNMALWFRYVPRNSIIVGPYICHNHYAGLMEMIFPVVLALFFFHRPRTRSLSIFKGIAEILSQEKANIHILIGTAALLIVTSVFVSLSRGGMISLSISLLFFTYLILKRRISHSNAFLIIAIIVFTALSVGWFGWDRIIERFARLKDANGILNEARLDFWKDSLHIIRDFFATGSGIGTFADIYPSYRSVTGNFFVNHAHNDYLELAVEGGITGLIIAAAFIITLFVKTYRAFLTRKDAYAVYIYMGSITGIIALLIHSLFDFNLHVGANGLWFFFLAGLAVSAVTTSMRNNSRAPRLAPVRSSTVKIAAVSAIALLTSGTIVFNVSALTGGYYYSHVRDIRPGPDTPRTELSNMERIAGMASRFAPLNGAYPFARANAAFALGEDAAALKYFSRAVSLDPTNSYYLNRLGGIHAARGEQETAERLLAASTAVDISNAEYALEYGAWLLSNQETARALTHIKRAVGLDRNIIDGALVTMALYRVSETDMRSAVPDVPEAMMTFADFLYSSGKPAAARAQYLESLSSIEKQDRINRSQFYRIYRFFKKDGDTQNALKVMTRAAELLPEDPEIRISLGDIYRDMGIVYRAGEEYQQAVLLAPDNRKARLRLDKLEAVNP